MDKKAKLSNMYVLAGPLFLFNGKNPHNSIQIGVTSWSNLDDDVLPDAMSVFGRISVAIPWIRRTTKKYNDIRVC